MIRALLLSATLLTSSFATTGVDIVEKASNLSQLRREERLINEDLPKAARAILARGDIPDSHKKLNINLECEWVVKNTYSQIALHRHKMIYDAFYSKLIKIEDIPGLAGFEHNYVWDNGQLKDKYGNVFYEFKG